MFKKRNGKFKLFGALGISLFGVLVSSIATAAWFQRNVVDSKEFEDAQSGTTGHSAINVVNTNSYKYKYDELGFDNTGSNGTVIGDTATGNIDQGIEEPLDLPNEGVGFYVVGNSDFTGSSSTAWKFTGARKMSDRYADNYARIELNLTTAMKIKIKEHTYEDAKAVNRTMTSYGSSSYSAKASMNTDTGEITINNAGTFHIYVNYNREVVIGSWAAPAAKDSPKINTFVTRSNEYSNSGNNIFVDTSNFPQWENDGAKCVVYWGLGGIGNSDLHSFSNHVATIPIPTDCENLSGTIYIKRTDSVNYTWHEFSVSYSSTYKNCVAKVTGLSTGSWDTSLGYQIVGEGSGLSNWDSGRRIHMNDTPGTNNYAAKHWEITEETTFRIVYRKASGTEWEHPNPDIAYVKDSSYDNVSIVETHNIKITNPCFVTVYFKFDNGNPDGQKYHVWVSPDEKTISYKYRIRKSDDSDWAASPASFTNYSTASETFKSGASVTAIASPTYSTNYKWEGHWFTSDSTFTSSKYYSTSRQKDSFTVYTYFYEPITVTYQYKIWKSDDSDAISENWINYRPSTSHQTGSSISAPDSPSIGSNTTWCGTWYTDTTLESPFVSGTKNSNQALYTKFLDSIDVTRYYKIMDSTGSELVADFAQYDTTNYTTNYEYTPDDGSKLGYTWCEKWYTDTSCTDEYSDGTKLNDDLKLYTIFYEIPFNLTIKVAYAQSRASTPTFDGNTGRASTTIEISAGTSVTETYLDSNSSSLAYDSTNYVFKGYYKTLSSPSAGGTFSNQITDGSPESFSSEATVYKVYQPKAFVVKYQYKFIVRDRITRSETEWTGLSISQDSVGNFYYGEVVSIASHNPTTTAYVASDDSGGTSGHSGGNGFYKFAWDGKVWDGSTSYSSSFTATSAKTYTIKLIAEYDVMNVIVRSTDSRWHGSNNLYLNCITSRNSGEGEVPLQQRSDECWYYRISNSLVHQVKTNHGDANPTCYTDNITLSSWSATDSKGGTRGTFHDAIEILNTGDTTGSGHRKWAWSIYFGEAKAGAIFKSGSSTGVTMYRGDGQYNIMIKDDGVNFSAGEQIGIRLYNDGDYQWYGFANITDEDDTPLYVEEGDTASNLGDATNKNSTIKMIKFKSAGAYSFYLTSKGKIAIASVPAEKGEGYYIMPYSSTTPTPSGKNGSTASYVNGVKLRTIPDATDGQNQAMYTNYHVANDGDQFYIRSFLSGVDHGVIKNLDTNDFCTIDSTTGVINFTYAGHYNIFVGKSESTYTIYVAETERNFNSLNKFKNTGEGATVKNNNTSLVIEVEFTITASITSAVGVQVTRDASSTGLSNYLMFGVHCNGTTELGKSCYNTMRTSYYSGSTFDSDIGVLNVIDSTNKITTCDGSTHYFLYILIDYKDLSIKDNTDKAYNDFKISLIARS